jgi:tRNA A-37 threonylcarbamoyl transferase component Bud32
VDDPCRESCSEVVTTPEKQYRINDAGLVLKLRLRKSGYFHRGNSDTVVPVRVVERLKNEARCMAYIKQHTDIPVPQLPDEYKKDGSYYLWMGYVNGVEMSTLTVSEQSKVIPQGRSTVPYL